MRFGIRRLTSTWPQKFDAGNYAPGKAACKAALQAEMGLPVRPEVPVLAAIGRLAEQKGFDLIADVLARMAQQQDAQWVLLGSGDKKYQDALAGLARSTRSAWRWARLR